MTQISSIVLNHEEKFAKQEIDNKKLKLEIEKLRDQVEAIRSADDDGIFDLPYHDDDEDGNYYSPACFFGKLRLRCRCCLLVEGICEYFTQTR
jgi:hypothetical protein